MTTTGVRLEQTVLVGGHGVRSMQSLGIRLPERVRRASFAGIGSPERIRYALDVTAILVDVKPPVVVVRYDDGFVKPPRYARGHAGTPVLSQHGCNCEGATDQTRCLDSLSSVDAVVTHSKATDQLLRTDLHTCEPPVFVRPGGVDTARVAPVSEQEPEPAWASWEMEPQARTHVLEWSTRAPCLQEFSAFYERHVRTTCGSAR